MIPAWSITQYYLLWLEGGIDWPSPGACWWSLGGCYQSTGTVQRDISQEHFVELWKRIKNRELNLQKVLAFLLKKALVKTNNSQPWMGTSWNPKNGCLVISNHWSLWNFSQQNHPTIFDATSNDLPRPPVFTRCSSSLGLWFGDEGGDGMGWSHSGYTLRVGGRGPHTLQHEYIEP